MQNTCNFVTAQGLPTRGSPTVWSTGALGLDAIGAGLAYAIASRTGRPPAFQKSSTSEAVANIAGLDPGRNRSAVGSVVQCRFEASEPKITGAAEAGSLDAFGRATSPSTDAEGLAADGTTAAGLTADAVEEASARGDCLHAATTSTLAATPYARNHAPDGLRPMVRL